MQQRVPVTIQVLKFLKRVIADSEWNVEKKLRVWLICCLLWTGSLRVHEVLSWTKNTFDPITTLCGEDLELVKFKDKNLENALIRVHLKSPKENLIGNGVKLDIFGNNSFCCPVRAWKKWSKKVVIQECLPIFREGKTCFTGGGFKPYKRYY